MSSLILLGLVGGGLYAISRMRRSGSSTLASHAAQGNAVAGTAALQASQNDFPPGPLHDLVQHVLNALSDPASQATLLAEAHGTPISPDAHNAAIADLVANQEPLAWPLAQVTSNLTPATAEALLTAPGVRIDAFIQQALLQSSTGLGQGPMMGGLTRAQATEIVHLDAACRASVDVVREQIGADPVDWVSIDHMAAQSGDPALVQLVSSRDPMPPSTEALFASHSKVLSDTADMLETAGDPSSADSIRLADATLKDQIQNNVAEMQAASIAAVRPDTYVRTSFATGNRQFFAGDTSDALIASPVEETGLADLTEGVSDIQAPGADGNHFGASDRGTDNLPFTPLEERPPITDEITAHTSMISREGIPTDPSVITVDVFDPKGDAEGRGGPQTMQWPPHPAAPPDGYHWELRPDLSDDSTAGFHAPWLETWSEGSGTWTLVRDGFTAPGVD